ncbi:MAG TPA: phosphoribosylaminoimidazolesuccinocarboxamide synthase [Bacteriovoracaceae bacterium]|nr:phosphoribosylaminoimidazolesuccinocarboxamide synthase [Bacteriovoracaceae bacterium]
MKPELTYQGSVKNVYKIGHENLFEFSDRYSVFDWGEMPDHLEKKGEALALMGALFFDVMSKNGIDHHFIALTDKDGHETKAFAPTNFMKVKNIPVVRPLEIGNGKYGYDFYKTRPTEGLVPLEVMFRFGISKGSSLLKRAQQDPALLKQWNLGPLHEGIRFEKPIIDFSTKLEKGDRYLTHSEAQELAGLTSDEFKKLIELNTKVAIILADLFKEINLELWDGKTEWAYTSCKSGERNFMLVDTIGLDELRLETKGQFLSKEFLRQYYKKSDWYLELEKTKAHEANFRQNMVSAPEHLPESIKFKAESLYMSFTNELAQFLKGSKPFANEHALNKWLELKS